MLILIQASVGVSMEFANESFVIVSLGNPLKERSNLDFTLSFDIVQVCIINLLMYKNIKYPKSITNLVI